MKSIFKICWIVIFFFISIDSGAQSTVLNPYAIAGHGHYWDEVDSTGARWARMWSQDGAALWGEIQPSYIDSFYWDNLDAWVKEIDAEGYHMMLTVRTGGDSTSFHPCKWTDVSFDSTVHPFLPSNFLLFKEASFPPRDYNEWYDFVYAITERYDGKHTDETGDTLPEILYFETQAENDISTYWYGTQEEYYDMFLPTFYKAVHDANPDAVVIGGSITDKGIGLAIIDSMIIQGVDTATIVSYYRHYFYGEDDITWDDIVKENNNSLVKRRIAMANYSFRPINDTVYYDKRGFHNYVRYNYLRDHIDYERKSMKKYGYLKDMWGTEVGIFDPLTFPEVPEDVHAQQYQKKMILQFVEDVKWFCFAPMTANPNDITNIFSPMYSLLPFKTPVAREMRDAFAFIAGKINEVTGYYFDHEDTVNSVVFYYFLTDFSDNVFVAAWAPEGKTVTTSIHIPDQPDSLVVYDYLGNISWPGYTDSLTMTYTSSPVFIEWKTTPAYGVSESSVSPDIPGLKIYPNPFRSYAIVEIPYPEKGIFTLEIYNSRGQLVRVLNNLEGEKIRLDKKHVPGGLYILKLKSNKVVISAGKLVVE